MRYFAAWAVIAAAAATGTAGGVKPPPGWSEYAPPESQAFTPKTAFNEPLVRPLPAPEVDPNAPPGDPPIGAGADGGLLDRVIPIRLQEIPLPELPPIPRLPDPWSGGMELGLTGATGNTELLTFTGGWNLRRKTDRHTLYTDLLYTYSTQDGELNANQALFNARNEMPFSKYSLTAFSATQVEYDELRAYRFRVGTYLGVGYTLVDDDYRTAKVRFGAGATRELAVGGPPDRWVPELVFGYDLRYQLNDRAAILTVADVYPRLGEQAGEYRVRTRAALEFIVDPESGTVLRMGLQDRYDSNPGNNTVRNDLTYFTTLGIKF